MSDQFLNVYNFVPLPKKKAKKYDDTDQHTGYIEYQITTKTPLFIPNTSNEDYFNVRVKDHKSYDFFSYTDLSNDYSGKCHKPVIPGSQVRGMIRSIYETVTASCLSTLNNDADLSNRVGTNYDPGLLHKVGNHYELYSADSFALEEAEGLKDGEKIHFKKTSKNFAVVKEDELQEGYVFRGEYKLRDRLKKNEFHVYEKDEYICDFEEEDVCDLLLATIKSYQIQKNGERHYVDYKKRFLDFLNGQDENGNPVEEYFPVNFKWIDDDSIYLSCARITREVSFSKVKDMVRDFNPCSDKETICPSCDLFGTIEEGDLALTSKLRFSDLEVEEKENLEDYFEKVVTLLPLGGPKLSNTAFYFKKPANNAAYWTFDYYVANKQVITKTAEIQGRKYYWHFKPTLKEKTDVQDKDKKRTPSNLNKTIRPLKEGITFTGKIYFDRISNKQLEQLKLILNGFDGKCSYKLGTGKPLGLGSVDCKLTEIKERINVKDGRPCFEEENVPLETKSYAEVGFNSEVEAPFKLISDFHACEGLTVSYPEITRDDKGYEWYEMKIEDITDAHFKNYLKPLAKGKNVSDLLLGRDGLKGNLTSKKSSKKKNQQRKRR